MSALGALLLLAAAPGDSIADDLAKASPGTRFGLVVVDPDGRELVALLPDQRFIPASNTKIFTTATAYATLPVDQPDTEGGAAVRLDGPDVVLEGHGDARLSSVPDCATDCLATLADAVAARTKRVRDVVGDDSAWPDERWSPGMSWNNFPTRSGTAGGALMLDDDEVVLFAGAGAAGAPPRLTGPGYFGIDNRAVTIASGRTDLSIERDPMSRTIRLTGTIALGAAPEKLRLGIDDPADYAAWTLREMLRARGVRVSGTVAVRHRPLVAADDPARRGATPPARPPAPLVLAKLTPPPLAADIVTTNKVSQNLHAQALLRRVGARAGTGSLADGLAVERAVLARAGVPRDAFDFADGSGMSTYNRISPRGAVVFLRWIAAQPWGPAWRASLPVGGQTGFKRFAGTPLDGKLWAKTGTLNATDALAGYLEARSGKLLTFAFYANDVPRDAGATAAMDRALLAVAAAN